MEGGRQPVLGQADKRAVSHCLSKSLNSPELVLLFPLSVKSVFKKN